MVLQYYVTLMTAWLVSFEATKKFIVWLYWCSIVVCMPLIKYLKYYTIQDTGEIIWYHWKSNWNSLRTEGMKLDSEVLISSVTGMHGV